MVSLQHTLGGFGTGKEMYQTIAPRGDQLLSQLQIAKHLVRLHSVPNIFVGLQVNEYMKLQHLPNEQSSLPNKSLGYPDNIYIPPVWFCTKSVEPARKLSTIQEVSTYQSGQI